VRAALEKILATTSSFATESPDILDVLRTHDLQLIRNPLKRVLTEKEVIELLEKVKPIGMLAGTEPITMAVIDKAKDYLRVISRVGVGLDNVDLAEAGRRGVIVYRTVGVLTQAVAELTISMILNALRSIMKHHSQLRQKAWQKNMGRLFQGKTIGIIGFGDIGQRVGELAKAFGADVIYYDPQAFSIPWADAVTLSGLLASAHIVTIHASGKERILGHREFESLGQPGVIIVNTSRGELIDEEALAVALKKGTVSFACLDVFAEEPYCGPLCDMENVILTPHIGSYAKEARQKMEETAVANLIAGLRVQGLLK
jgi:D-3-phosphoglycerate dehydrogenase / 2-oxoglutarate reductase